MNMRILNFENFLNEKLGYSNEIENLTNYIIDYLENLENLNKNQIIEIKIPEELNLSIKISKLLVEVNNVYNKIASFDFNQSNFDEKGSIIYLTINPEKITHGIINHELFHVFDWIKSKGKMLVSNEEMSLISLDTYFSNDKINEIIHLIYETSDAELKSDYNKAVYEIKTYLQENNIKDKEEIKKTIKEHEYYSEYEYVKNINLEHLFNKLTNYELNELMTYYYVMLNLDYGKEITISKIKYHEKSEKENFINYFVNIFNKQKSTYKKYIERLFSILYYPSKKTQKS